MLLQPQQLEGPCLAMGDWGQLQLQLQQALQPQQLEGPCLATGDWGQLQLQLQQAGLGPNPMMEVELVAGDPIRAQSSISGVQCPKWEHELLAPTMPAT